MNTAKHTVHFTDKYLLSPQNPIIINLIGAGGTGSQVLTCLARMNHSLIALDHPGLFVRLFDGDTITKANLGRQLFSRSELGLNKSSALISRVNRFFGTDWKAICEPFSAFTDHKETQCNITISCVDKAQTRFEIAEILKSRYDIKNAREKSLYWMDFGNGQKTGQVVLSTVTGIKQPESKKFQTVPSLPFVTDEYKIQLSNVNDNDQPSCSLSEALTRQDLFINTTLSALGCSLLWNLFRDGMISNRGLFLNLQNFRSQPIPLQTPSGSLLA